MARRPGYQRADAKSRAAKAAGYPARSVFKLEEIDRRCQLLRRGHKVLDLGAAPGSWTLFAAERVGPSGRVVAIDLSVIQCSVPPHVVTLTGDAFDDPPAAVTELAPFDVVLSDMAPATSGSKVQDQARSQELCERALGVADALGRAGSHFVAKLFMNAEYPAFKRAVAERYETCRVIRPEATRNQSSEVFLVGLRRRATALPRDGATG